jgi:hypothetical protein
MNKQAIVSRKQIIMLCFAFLWSQGSTILVYTFYVSGTKYTIISLSSDEKNVINRIVLVEDVRWLKNRVNIIHVLKQLVFQKGINAMFS